MTTSAETRAVIVEREVAHPPEKVWRALTQSHLIGEWLMKTDFRPEIGHYFTFSAEWGGVECEVLDAVPERLLSYSWNAGDLRSLVTWTLAETSRGTRLRMEQTGFTDDQPRYYGGAKAGWPQFFVQLEKVLESVE